MITNIVNKSFASSQGFIYEKHQELIETNPSIAGLSAIFVSAVDVLIETIKYPAAAFENSLSSAMNTVGSPFSNKCTLLDASQSFKTAIVMVGATPVMVFLSPLIFLESALVNLSNPKEASSCNRQANEQARFSLIAYDSRECRALQEAIENDDCAAIGEILDSGLLTNQSLGIGLEKAAENGLIDAMKLLLADPTKLIQQSIARALEKATKNDHSKIILLLLAELMRPAVDKKKHQEDNQFIARCLDKIIQIAEKNMNIDLVNKLNIFKIDAKIA